MSQTRKKFISRRIRTRGGLVKLTYTPHEIEKKTKMIYRKVIGASPYLDRGNFSNISNSNLQRLFELYDHYFFNNYLSNNYADWVSLRFSNKMTKTGGKTSYWKQTETFEICISIALIYQTFEDVIRTVQINGIICRDRLEATMRILEHEIIHLVELIAFGKSSCSQPLFKQLSKNVFNHQGVTHQLVTYAERAHKKFNLLPGDHVTFNINGKSYYGTIQRITKRATVMVPDPQGDFIDGIGRPCCKFYVPISILQSTDKN